MHVVLPDEVGHVNIHIIDCELAKKTNETRSDQDDSDKYVNSRLITRRIEITQ